MNAVVSHTSVEYFQVEVFENQISSSVNMGTLRGILI